MNAENPDHGQATSWAAVTERRQIKVSGVLADIRLDPAFMTFGPAAARGDLPNLVEALMDAAVG